LTTPACSSADTGVGASITWTSQPCSCAHQQRLPPAAVRRAAAHHVRQGLAAAMHWSIPVPLLVDNAMPATTQAGASATRLM
jgi:hypothetical protein